ncbi:beta-1,3-galactosyltransferase 5-like [Styela clava]
MATRFIRNGLAILITLSFCGMIYYLYETSTQERWPKHNLGMNMLGSYMDLPPSMNYSIEPTLFHPMSSFKQFGLEEISFLKKMDTKRSLFNITMAPWKMMCTNNTNHSTDSRWAMIVAVKTGYNRIEQRNRIRKTWGFNKFLDGVCLDVIFVVASTTTTEENLNLRKEESVHGDILQVELEETYRNIGLKALASMQWTADHFPSNWIYSSADDDMSPDFSRLYKNIEKLMSQEGSFSKYSVSGVSYDKLNTQKLPIFCAYSYRPAAKPKRNKCKWQISVEIYPYEYYPPFCLGGFYSMSVKQASAIYTVSRWYPYFHLDDVWITGFMRLRFCDLMTDREFIFNKTDINCGMSTMAGGRVKHGF